CVKYASKRDFCEDIREGKFALPVIMALASDEDKKEEDTQRLLEILERKSDDPRVRARALHIVHRRQGLLHTYETLQQLERRIRHRVAALSGDHENKLMAMVLQRLSAAVPLPEVAPVLQHFGLPLEEDSQ
ncbi:MAG: hypothetical protein MHM6MM_006841, partial [Cercozoa sp. M6MM]